MVIFGLQILEKKNFFLYDLRKTFYYLIAFDPPPNKCLCFLVVLCFIYVVDCSSLERMRSSALPPSTSHLVDVLFGETSLGLPHPIFHSALISLREDVSLHNTHNRIISHIFPNGAHHLSNFRGYQI